MSSANLIQPSLLGVRTLGMFHVKHPKIMERRRPTSDPLRGAPTVSCDCRRERPRLTTTAVRRLRQPPNVDRATQRRCPSWAARGTTARQSNRQAAAVEPPSWHPSGGQSKLVRTAGRRSGLVIGSYRPHRGRWCDLGVSNYCHPPTQDLLTSRHNAEGAANPVLLVVRLAPLVPHCGTARVAATLPLSSHVFHVKHTVWARANM